MADLHITPNIGSSFSILDDDSSENNILDNVSRTEDLYYDDTSSDNAFKENRKLKLEISSETESSNKANVNDPSVDKSQENQANDPLSPTSIWSRTREANLDLTASSNESDYSPFRFDEELEKMESPSYTENSTFRQSNEYSSDSEDNSFHSVASSIESSILTAEEGSNWVYLLGKVPTEIDRQVYDIIKEINVDQYPSINAWKILIETYSTEEREQWKSYEKQIKNLTSELLVSQSNIVDDVKSKLLFED